MPRISTENYDTVASWNGSQDLFIVEQPDGTKVATPAMVKQFIEAGDFEATGEVKDGHGNILKDMAKSVDVNEVIGDLSQTGLTGDSVAEQLETAKNQIAKRTEYFKSSTNGTTQTINIGVAPTENRTFLFACGFHTNYVLELIAMSGAGNITHIPIANSSINSISNISYNANTGDMTITVLNNPFTNGRMTRLS